VAEDPFRDVTPEQLKQWFAEDRVPRLIDVREPEEWALVRLPGAELMPVGQISAWSATLDAEQDLVLYCHHGIRSLHAAMYLAAHGFARVMHLRGGLDAYSQQADPTIPRY
jgi:rhodanese-related sulfurtransferase